MAVKKILKEDIIDEDIMVQEFTGAEPELSERQMLFCKLMAENDNLAKAYSYAFDRKEKWTDKGKEPTYCRMKAKQMMNNNPRILKTIDDLKLQNESKMLAEFRLDKHFVVSNLKKVYDECMKPKIVKDRHGNVLEGSSKIDATGANKALELLGKTLNLFNDEVKELNAIQINVTLKDSNEVIGDVIVTDIK